MGGRKTERERERQREGELEIDRARLRCKLSHIEGKERGGEGGIIPPYLSSIQHDMRHKKASTIF